MLTDEQLAVLPEYVLNLCFSADVALLDNRGRSWEEGILLMASELATALLARQRLERRVRRVLATAKLDRSLRVAMEGALHLLGDERDELLGAAKSLKIRWQNALHEKDWTEAHWHQWGRAWQNKSRWSAAWKSSAKKWYVSKPVALAQKELIAELQAERDEERIAWHARENTLLEEAEGERDDLRKKHKLTANNRDGWRARAFKTEKERDELRRQLDGVMEDPLSVCEKCDEGKQMVPLQRQCNELRRRLEEAREVLRGLEWITKCDDCNLEGFEAFCGKCGAWKKDGHDGSCTVAALRGGEEGR